MRPPKQRGFSQRPPLSYNTLDNDKHEIRLLTLHPGSWRARIRCSLTTVSLDDEPAYEALSYAWGSPDDTFPIFVNDCVFHTTVNLWYALRRLRGTAPRTLWVDAIYINQDDNDEKSFQVAMMRGVFEQCSTGLLWLGEDTGTTAGKAHRRFTSTNTRRAVALLRLLARDVHITEHPCLTMQSVKPRFIVEQSYRGHFSSLNEIMALPWWQCIWVLQEACLPPTVTFIRASETISIDLFQYSTESISYHLVRCCSSMTPCMPSILPKILYQFTKSLVPFRMRDIYQNDLWYSYHDVTKLSRYMKATKPQDAIYGLLGFARPGEARSIRPDYSRPVVEAFVEALLVMMENERSLLMIYGKRNFDRAAVAGPSWIPDHMLSLVYGQDSGHTSGNAMDTRQASAGNFETPEKNDNLIIKVRVLRLGAIKEVSATLYSDSDKDFYRAMDCWKRFSQMKTVELPNEELAEMPTEKRLWTLFVKALTPDKFLEEDFDCNPSTIPWEILEERYKTAHAIWKANPDSTRSQEFNRTLPIISGMMLFVTNDGRFGVTGGKTAKDDEVYLLIGGPAPFILRRNPHPLWTTTEIRCSLPVFSVIEECHVEGVMDGELLQGDWRDRVEEIALS